MSRFRSATYYLRGSGEIRGFGGGYRSKENVWPLSSNKHNNNILTYHSQHLQEARGAGLASTFANIYSAVVPLMKSALRIGSSAAKSEVGKQVIKGVKNRAMRAGLNVVSDALEGKNIIKSTKNELNSAKKALKERLVAGYKASKNDLKQGLTRGINAAVKRPNYDSTGAGRCKRAKKTQTKKLKTKKTKAKPKKTKKNKKINLKSKKIKKIKTKNKKAAGRIRDLFD